MQLRTLALLCSIVGFLYSGLASALGLGEISLKSQFNQPLNAEIRLLKVRDLSEEEILAALAPREDFKRAGVDRTFFLTGLSFEVVLDNPSNPFIRVTSQKAVTEPYLNFLLELQWPSGRLLREYTLLLDLPVYSQAPANSAPITRPATTQTRPETVQRPSVQAPSSRPVNTSPAPVTSEPQPRTTSRVSNTPVDSYRVRSGDTLWEIAERVRPNTSTSINQTMIAIQQSNPDAFIGGNINRLKNGRVLNIPDADDINAISYQQAVSSVRRQNQDWSTGANQKPVLTSAAPTSSQERSTSQPEGRLTLGSADSSSGDVKGAGASGSGESLQNELSIAKDELSRANRENSELRSRVSELEAQIKTMEDLVKVTNDQLTALQIAAQNNNSQIEAGSQPAVSDDPPAATDSSTVEGSVDNATSEPPVVDEPPVTVEQPVVEQPKPANPPMVKQTPTPEQGFDLIGFIKSNLLVIGGGLLALLVVVLVLFRLREKSDDTDYDEFELGQEDNFFEEDELDTPVAQEESDFDLDEEEEDVQAQTEDVVAEADIYVSLGQEDKAIELLQKEIQQNPENADARLGLLKIYSSMQNAAAFDEQYVQLLPLGNVYANDQAMALRKDIEGIEPFDTDQYSVDVATADSDNTEIAQAVDDGFDLDLDDTDDEDDLSLDLDLDGALDDVDSDEFAGADTELDDISFESDSDDLDDISLDLDDLDDDLNEYDTEVSLEGLDDEFEFDLDLDESTDSDSNEDTGGDYNLVDEMSADLDRLDTDLDDNDDLDISLDTDLDDELDISLDTDSLTEVDLSDESMEDGLTSALGDIELDGDLEEFETEDSSDSSDLEFDLDFEAADAALEEAEPLVETNLADIDEDDLDFDTPPSEDLDLASLDEEIDAMTADLDEPLPLDDMNGDDSVTDDFDLDIDLPSNEDEPTELTGLASEDTLDALTDNDDEAMDILASNELDELTGLDDTAEDELSDDDVTVVSAMQEASISQEEELDFLEESDEVSTKLDLAKAYIDMGDREGAEDILKEVVEEGNADQKSEAEELMRTM